MPLRQPARQPGRRPGKRIRADLQLQEELALCREYKISHSHFSGGKNRWTDVDRAKAIAYERFINSKCKKCGTSHEDWFDDDGYPLEEPHFEAVIRACDGCIAVHHASKAIDEDAHGAYVTLVPFGTAVLTPEEEEDIL